jgi:hypothetical protein
MFSAVCRARLMPLTQLFCAAFCASSATPPDFCRRFALSAASRRHSYCFYFRQPFQINITSRRLPLNISRYFISIFSCRRFRLRRFHYETDGEDEDCYDIITAGLPPSRH